MLDILKILMAPLVVNCFTTPVLATEATDRVSSFYAAGDNPDFPAKNLDSFLRWTGIKITIAAPVIQPVCRTQRR
jgi:hypothetical protein